jgi:hypothetical protein
MNWHASVAAGTASSARRRDRSPGWPPLRRCRRSPDPRLGGARLALVGMDPLGFPLGEDAALLLVQPTADKRPVDWRSWYTAELVFSDDVTSLVAQIQE